jgi:D-glycero-D-manno-heptose 1,7-bisphosphate phosphatase
VNRPGASPRTGAVFLDRDGTLIEEVGNLERVERVALYPWSVDAIRLLNRAGFRVVVITNQSGVARGYFAEAVVDAVHRHIDRLLADSGARIDAYYYCPHHPDGTVEPYNRQCDCRKPGRGLIDRAATDLAIDPAASFVVGDRWLDIAMARAVGARAVLVRTGWGITDEARPLPDLVPDAITDNLIAATTWILRHRRDHPPSST